MRTELIGAVAAVLDQAGVARWIPEPVDKPSEIFAESMPPGLTRGVSLVTFNADDLATLPEGSCGLQITIRGGQDSRVTSQLAWRVFSVLHDRRRIPFGDGGLIHWIRRQSSNPLATDGNGIYEAVDNYEIQYHRPRRDI